MGAYRAWMLSALSDKVKAGAAVCWMVTTDCQFSWEYGKERGGFANMLPGIRRYLDYPHIASIACPKPMFFLNGEHDKLFPPVGVNARLCRNAESMGKPFGRRQTGYGTVGYAA